MQLFENAHREFATAVFICMHIAACEAFQLLVHQLKNGLLVSLRSHLDLYGANALAVRCLPEMHTVDTHDLRVLLDFSQTVFDSILHRVGRGLQQHLCQGFGSRESQVKHDSGFRQGEELVDKRRRYAKHVGQQDDGSTQHNQGRVDVGEQGVDGVSAGSVDHVVGEAMHGGGASSQVPYEIVVVPQRDAGQTGGCDGCADQKEHAQAKLQVVPF